MVMRSLLPTLLDRAVVAPRLVDRLFEDNLFDRWFDDMAMRWPTVQNQFVRPFEVRETEDAYLVRCEVPGYGPDDVHVELTGDALTIRGEIGSRDKDEGSEGERRYASFTQSIRLGVEIDRDSVEAELKNGVLMVRLPKSPSEQPRRIEIKASSADATRQLEHQPEKAVDATDSAQASAGSAS